MYSAKIICDSISETGKRLTTFEITFPRIVLAEFNTHRMLSRNSASSRAIPFKKQFKRIMENPFIPERFPINTSGMQPKEYIEQGDADYTRLKEQWLNISRRIALDAAALHDGLSIDGLEGKQKVHKQLVNRLLEPFMWHTVIVTATEWDNFFKLRTNEQAQYEIRRIADLMYDEYHRKHSLDCETICRNLKDDNNCDCRGYKPKQLKVGEWHLPFISEEDYELIEQYIRDKKFIIPQELGARFNLRIGFLKKVSVARCARVSYLTHDGKRDIEKDLELFEKLRTSGHWSPFEHIATPNYNKVALREFQKFCAGESKYNPAEHEIELDLRSGNFIGWKQFRKEFSDENCTYFKKDS